MTKMHRLAKVPRSGSKGSFAVLKKVSHAASRWGLLLRLHSPWLMPSRPKRFLPWSHRKVHSKLAPITIRICTDETQGCSSPNRWKTSQAVKRSIETSSAMRGPRKFCQINFQNICKLAHDLQADNGPPPSPAYC